MLEAKHIRTLRQSEVPVSGNRVALAIELTDKKQVEVAEEIGMPQSQLSDITRGRFPDPKLSTLQKLADYFGCAIEDLFPSRAA